MVIDGYSTEMAPAQGVLFHIGYHKTGTSWMQRSLFTETNGYMQLMSHAAVFEHIVRPSDLCFDRSAASEILEKGIASARERNLVPVVSSEILCGNPFYGGHGSFSYAKRLRAATKNAKIFITVREQFSAIASTYMQYLHQSGSKDWRLFFNEGPTPGYCSFEPSHFEYHRLVGHYIQLFGHENVLVATQEQLALDPESFLRGVETFTRNKIYNEVPYSRVSESFPERAAPWLRRLNRLRSGPASTETMVDLRGVGYAAYVAVGRLHQKSALKKLNGNRRPVYSYVKERFSGRFVESNRSLEALARGKISLSGYEGI